MGKQQSNDNRVPGVRRVVDACVGNLSDLTHNKLLVYIMISIALAIGIGVWDHNQRHDLAVSNARADYRLATQQFKSCLDIEAVKRQANTRIELLKVAQKAVIFRTPRIQHKLALLVDHVKPLPAVDCTPLRPGK